MMGANTKRTEIDLAPNNSHICAIKYRCQPVHGKILFIEAPTTNTWCVCLEKHHFWCVFADLSHSENGNFRKLFQNWSLLITHYFENSGSVSSLCRWTSENGRFRQRWQNLGHTACCWLRCFSVRCRRFLPFSKRKTSNETSERGSERANERQKE